MVTRAGGGKAFLGRAKFSRCWHACYAHEARYCFVGDNPRPFHVQRQSDVHIEALRFCINRKERGRAGIAGGLRTINDAYRYIRINC